MIGRGTVMKRVDPSKLLVTVMPPATLVRPVDGRRYTLSESNDQKNDLHLRIGYHFDHNQDEKSEDKLLGIWTYQQGIYILDVTVLMNTNENSEMDATMLTELSGKMEDYLTAFVIGDIQFYKDFPWLLDAPYILT